MSVPIFNYVLIYPSRQEPPPFTAGEAILEDKWGFSWSEPVRQKIAPRLAIALIASGLSYTPNPPFTVYPAWYSRLSEPVRLKPGLKAHLQQAFTMDAKFIRDTATILQGFNWWSEPVRRKRGLSVQYQQFWTGPVRDLPNPTVSVTVTLNAMETNTDEALFAVNVTDSTPVTVAGEGARVSIIEVAPDGDNAAASVIEG